MKSYSCQSCGSLLQHTFCDLGLSPVSNAFIRDEDADKGEMFYPLRALVCDKCWLVQLVESPKSEMHFHGDYVYFSSFSDSWLAHAEEYVDSMVTRLNLGSQSKVMEIASNDGYLLQYFVKRKIPCLGIEPTSNTAAAARLKGVETREEFFGVNTAKNISDDGWKVDLLLGNNVLAHVPDINDFVGGMPLVLKKDGVVTLEFPHLLSLINENQFDTIYHEHYSYLSLTALQTIFDKCGLRVFEVEKISTHGGSLRVFLCHASSSWETKPSVQQLIDEEKAAGLTCIETYTKFASNVIATKRALLNFILEAKESGKRIGAYGAAAKGNTLLNYCGIGKDFIDFVADKNPVKQGCLLPGVRIPVVSPDVINSHKPDYLLILPWNIKGEVLHQMREIRNWGGQFVVPIPSVQVLP